MAIAGSQVQFAYDLLRKTINDPSPGGKYSADMLMQLYGTAFDRVIQDLNVSLGKDQIIMSIDMSFNTTVKDYLLPAMVGTLMEVGVLDSAGGKVNAYIPAYGFNEIRGPNFLIVPPFIRFDELFNTTTYIRLSFVPSGMDFIHKATVAGSKFGASTLQLSTTPDLGLFDPRPNAFYGAIVRVTGAGSLPGGYVAFPWQERIITNYAVATATITVNLPWDFSLTALSNVQYEILPLVDNDLLQMAVIELARHICSLEQRTDRVRTLTGEYEYLKASARRKYQNRNRARQPGTPSRLELKPGTQGGRRRPLGALPSIVTGP